MLLSARIGYRCQICDFLFADHYGKLLGDAFAEAHHIRPLGKQTGQVKTTVGDLITVCSNCHRMLHRMEGKPGDIKRLQAIVGKAKRRKP